MKVLFQAIYTKFTTGTPAIYTDLGGRLYMMVPQDTTFPYAKYTKISGIHDFNFTEEFEDILIQFDIFEKRESGETESSLSKIGGYFADLIALFDDCSLSITGYTHIWMRREFDELIDDTERGVWQWVIQYRIFQEKN